MRGGGGKNVFFVYARGRGQKIPSFWSHKFPYFLILNFHKFFWNLLHAADDKRLTKLNHNSTRPQLVTSVPQIWFVFTNNHQKTLAFCFHKFPNFLIMNFHKFLKLTSCCRWQKVDQAGPQWHQTPAGDKCTQNPSRSFWCRHWEERVLIGWHRPGRKRTSQ